VKILCIAYDYPDNMAAFVKKVVDADNAAGHDNVHYYCTGKLLKEGCDGHPTVSTHAGIAENIAPTLRQLLGPVAAKPPFRAHLPCEVSGPARIRRWYDLGGRVIALKAGMPFPLDSKIAVYGDAVFKPFGATRVLLYR
jgi:hypothetical protein